MRKWAYISQESEYKKVMIYSGDKGVYVFLYDAPDAVFCCADEYYENEEDALAEWEDKIGPGGWHTIDDPLPDCQHDSILPIRVKGRDLGKPQWGQYEILVDGEWKEYVVHLRHDPRDSTAAR